MRNILNKYAEKREKFRSNWRLIGPVEYVHRFTKWAAEGIDFWFPVTIMVLIPAALIYANLACKAGQEPTLRLTGMLLQLVGFGTTILGINSTFSDLGPGSFTKRFLAHFSKIPLLPLEARKAAQVIVGSFHTNVSIGYSGAIGTTGNTLEERISALEQQLRDLQKETRDETRKLRETDLEIRRSLETTAKVHSKEISDIATKYDKIFVGNARLEFFGVVLFFFGVVLATASPEISAFIQQNYCT